MARRTRARSRSRSRSQGNPVQLIVIALVVIAILLGGWFLVGRAQDPFAGLTPLDVDDFMENANALRGNSYQIRCRIDERLDNWTSREGRFFAVLAVDGNNEGPLPLIIPPEFNHENIQRGQEYRARVIVGDNGVLILQELDRQ